MLLKSIRVIVVAERPDRRLKPGELTSGGYGFYYKGQQQVASQADVLQNLQAVMTPVETRPRSQEPAKPYKELISSPGKTEKIDCRTKSLYRKRCG